MLTTDKRAPRQDPVSLLGIIIDQHLTWTSHIDQVCSRVSRGLFALRRLTGLVTVDVLKTAYYALVHSHLSYGIILWGQSSELRRAFSVQKKAVRAMVSRGPREHCAPWFRQLRILTLPCLYIHTTCLYIHARSSLLRTSADVHEHATRSRDLFLIPASRTCSAEKNKVNIKLYNALPNNLKVLTMRNFKVKLKDLLLKHAFYDVDEFLRYKFSE